MNKSSYFQEEAERKGEVWTRVQKRFKEIKAKADSAEFETKFPKEAILLSAIFNAKEPSELVTALYKYYEAENGFDDYYDTREFSSYAESTTFDIRNYFTDECYDIENYFASDGEEWRDGLFVISEDDWFDLGLDDLIESVYPAGWFD